MPGAPVPNLTEKTWREIKRNLTWDQADALRAATMRDTPSLDVRLLYRAGVWRVEISGPEKP